MVDELAALKAAIAPLQEREAQIKDALKATGRERIDGTEHTAVVVLSERETVDTKALKADHPKLVEPYLKRSIVESLKLTARRTH
jgi:predicted phage-related endonuclease